MVPVDLEHKCLKIKRNTCPKFLSDIFATDYETLCWGCRKSLMDQSLPHLPLAVMLPFQHSPVFPSSHLAILFTQMVVIMFAGNMHLGLTDINQKGPERNTTVDTEGEPWALSHPPSMGLLSATWVQNIFQCMLWGD
jgi:hypothetical protein